MKLSEKFYDEIHGLYSEVRAAYEKLNGLQSALDRAVSSIYHDIEKSGEFSEAEGNNFAKHLKVTLQQRRVVKDELVRLQPVYQLLKSEIGKMDDQYDRAVRKSSAITQSLNMTMDIEDVFTALEV
jgi:predicted  nucleic acid-binding Zn-ribbon protein